MHRSYQKKHINTTSKDQTIISLREQNTHTHRCFMHIKIQKEFRSKLGTQTMKTLDGNNRFLDCHADIAYMNRSLDNKCDVICYNKYNFTMLHWVFIRLSVK